MSRQKMRFAKLKPNGIKDATWRRLVEAWENGLSDREAAFYVSKHRECDEITAGDIQKWMLDNPEIKDLKTNLHSDILASAKINIKGAIADEQDVATSKWYLERKAANEFSTKQAVAFEGAIVELSLEEKEKKLQEIVEKFEKGEE